MFFQIWPVHWTTPDYPSCRWGRSLVTVRGRSVEVGMTTRNVLSRLTQDLWLVSVSPSHVTHLIGSCGQVTVCRKSVNQLLEIYSWLNNCVPYFCTCTHTHAPTISHTWLCRDQVQSHLIRSCDQVSYTWLGHVTKLVTLDWVMWPSQSHLIGSCDTRSVMHIWLSSDTKFSTCMYLWCPEFAV